MIVFRHADPRLPFLWEDARQPPGRWHGGGEGPAHYFSDTPDGAWAELLRHEEIRDPADLATLRRAIWAVEIPDEEQAAAPGLADAQRGTLHGRIGDLGKVGCLVHQAYRVGGADHVGGSLGDGRVCEWILIGS